MDNTLKKKTPLEPLMIVVAVVAFSLPVRILGRMLDNSFPTCAFFQKWRLAHAH